MLEADIRCERLGLVELDSERLDASFPDSRIGQVETHHLGELAQMVGLDLTDPKIWEAGIDALAVELDEAEALAADIGL